MRNSVRALWEQYIMWYLTYNYMHLFKLLSVHYATPTHHIIWGGKGGGGGETLPFWEGTPPPPPPPPEPLGLNPANSYSPPLLGAHRVGDFHDVV